MLLPALYNIFLVGAFWAQGGIATPPAFTISGRLESVSESEQGRQLTLLSLESRSRRLVTAANDGTFAFHNLSSGNYSLFVSAPAAKMVSVMVTDHDVTGVAVPVPKLEIIKGTVAFEGSAARPRFAIIFSGRDGVSATVEGTAMFSVALPIGEYRVRLDRLPLNVYVKMIRLGEVELGDVPFVVSASTRSEIALVLGTTSGVQVKGNISISGSVAPPSVDLLRLHDEITGRTLEAAVDSDGTFELVKAVPGRYVAMITNNPAAPAVAVPVRIPEKDLDDLRIVVPPTMDVLGSVAVQGNGPSPHFDLLFVRLPATAAAAGKPESVPPIPTQGATVDGIGKLAAEGAQLFSVSIRPLADGTFRMPLPEGEYLVVAATDGLQSRPFLPPPYYLSSMTYGVANLLTDRLIASGAEMATLQIGFGVSVDNPWVRVSGHVVSTDRNLMPLRVSLTGRTTAAIEATVNLDGTFAFDRVLKNSIYDIEVFPKNPLARVPKVSVADKDLAGVQVVIPGEKQISGRVILEGDGPLPGFQLNLRSPDNRDDSVTFRAAVLPSPDGRFELKVPDDQRIVAVQGFPIGYKLKSLTSGGVDILNRTVSLSGNSELRAVFSLDRENSAGSVRGRVVGAGMEGIPLRVGLAGATAIASFEETTGSDGTFFFDRVPPGVYIVSLTGVSAFSPSVLTVLGNGETRLDIAVPKQSPLARQPPSPASPAGDYSTGAQIVELGSAVGSRRAANESAAVANLRTLNTAEIVLHASNGGSYGDVPALVTAGLLDGRFGASVSGFAFSVVAVGQDYVVAAIPTSPESGRFVYYSSPTGIVRYSPIERLAPPGQAGQPVQ